MLRTESETSCRRARRCSRKTSCGRPELLCPDRGPVHPAKIPGAMRVGWNGLQILPLSPLSVPAEGNDRSLPHTENFRGRILYSYPHRIAGSQMHPVQRPLHVGQTWAQTAEHIG